MKYNGNKSQILKKKPSIWDSKGKTMRKAVHLYNEKILMLLRDIKRIWINAKICYILG